MFRGQRILQDTTVQRLRCKTDATHSDHLAHKSLSYLACATHYCRYHHEEKDRKSYFPTMVKLVQIEESPKPEKEAGFRPHQQQDQMEPTKGDLRAEDVANTLLVRGQRVTPKRDEQWLVVSNQADNEQLLQRRLRLVGTAVHKSLRGSTYLENGP